MNHEHFNLPDHLLQTKRFEQLSDEERKQVLSTLSEQEYRELQTLYALLKPGANDDTPQLSGSVKEKLDAQFATRHPKTGVFAIRIPLWQAVAVALVVFMCGWLVNFRNDMPARIVTQRVEVLKYVDRPVKEIRYIRVHMPGMAQSVRSPKPKDVLSSENTLKRDALSVDQHVTEAGNNQVLASNTSRSTSTDSAVMSLGSDTVIRNMMVTAY